jgi:Na+/H+ antiporter NhaD/arsenite permease-like protein
MQPIPLLVLAAVLALIAVRRIGRYDLKIWQIMTAAAVLLLLTLQIAPLEAVRAINLDVILFLFAVFIIGNALEKSGYLGEIADKGFSKAKTTRTLLLAVIVVTGALSMLLMNDTIAIVGTPLVLHFATKHRMPHRALLLALAFSVTIGSVASPIGNPQNLLISIGGGMEQPFIEFSKYLLVPTIVNMVILYGLMLLFYGKDFGRDRIHHHPRTAHDRRSALLSKISLALLIALIIVRIVTQLADIPFLDLTPIALISCSPILIFGKRRAEILKGIDWTTLLFFASMFIVMKAVWNTGYLQDLAEVADLTAVPSIMVFSIAFSQLISNVPFVALFLNIIHSSGGGTVPLIALAAGSTIAGNLTILGAASNVIIIQSAEKRGHTIPYLDFIRIGIPLTILNALVYAVFIMLLS